MEKRELSTSEKTEVLVKVMAAIGISSHDLLGQFTESEPENKLEISGDTFVCSFNGKDYFCVDPVSCNGKARSLEMEFEKMPQIWVPISEIEIDDEIAKLRPMVMCSSSGPAMLFAYQPNEKFQAVVFSMNELNRFRNARLATAKDLK